ncbi:unnamed protein product [Notodromas monacha]|uniref:Uncharacterized protein n=1 Tax=Notodromas monacha TaxID=399045 RepID=A0A7R9GGK7_9CRUS|nr:unnamed protein product [Notodromas monacha]CAG0921813.1 unnamed protein product [Notodromas monacha]
MVYLKTFTVVLLLALATASSAQRSSSRPRSSQNERSRNNNPDPSSSSFPVVDTSIAGGTGTAVAATAVGTGQGRVDTNSIQQQFLFRGGQVGGNGVRRRQQLGRREQQLVSGAGSGSGSGSGVGSGSGSGSGINPKRMIAFRSFGGGRRRPQSERLSSSRGSESRRRELNGFNPVGNGFQAHFKMPPANIRGQGIEPLSEDQDDISTSVLP